MVTAAAGSTDSINLSRTDYQAHCVLDCLHVFVYVYLAQIKNGSQFVSETDTEVIPKLLKFAYDNWEGERLPFPKVGVLWVQPSICAFSNCLQYLRHPLHTHHSTACSGHSSAAATMLPTLP